MKKIIGIISLASLISLTACGNTQDIDLETNNQSETISNSQVIEQDDFEELSEEEINALFQEMMERVESEMLILEEQEGQIDNESLEEFNNLLLDENGELNPGLSDPQ